jgi:hypothetical protein
VSYAAVPKIGSYVSPHQTALIRFGASQLAPLLPFEVNGYDAVLDGEIAKLDESGRPQFYDLMRRRGKYQENENEPEHVSVLKLGRRRGECDDPKREDRRR